MLEQELIKQPGAIRLVRIRQKRPDHDLQCLVLKAVAWIAVCPAGHKSPYFKTRVIAQEWANDHRNNCH